MGKALLIIRAGGCHCGRIKFEVETPTELEVLECNCSICSKTGFLHLIVPKAAFRLIRGADDLIAYTFNTTIAKHLFCKVCGVKSFYVPRSNPDGYSVNARCLDGESPIKMTVRQFDGKHWEEHGAELADLSTGKRT
jgi:hypothetical protein